MSVVYDAIVLGTGGVGSSALYHLARRGLKVLGLDRFAPSHDQGSSHGQTRIIRQACFEHPNYSPLLRESYRLWSELESQVNKKLYHEVGVLQIGPPDGVVVPGVLRSADENNLPVEQLTGDAIRGRWPGLKVPDGMEGVLESKAGVLMVEQCVQSHLDLAQQAGAELRWPVEVQGWKVGEPVTVKTNEGEVEAKKLIITAGAWSGSLLAQLGLGFEVLRKSLFWYATDTEQYTVEKGFPGFLFELPNGIFYGFPQFDGQGLKVAEHSGGKPVADPLRLDRTIHQDEQERIERFLQEHFCSVSKQQTGHATCMYTMTPDEHFIVDRYPDNENVLIAAGLSGHGFKFTSVLGKILADLASQGETNLDIDFLSLDRFS